MAEKMKIAFIGSECHPFVKTGGLGDVMFALPRALVPLGCEVRIILPHYACIPQKHREKLRWIGSFAMDLGQTGRNYHVGILEMEEDGITYDFLDNMEFFSGSKPYTDLVADIPKYCFYSKAALAVLNYLDWIPDVLHCHDWQAALVPVFQRTLFKDTPVGTAKTAFTIHNLRFQGIYNIPTIRYWTGLPDEVYRYDVGAQGINNQDASMMKAGLSYADAITTVSETYAKEIQTEEYGETLETHLQAHNDKLLGIVNGIDPVMWDPTKDPSLVKNYDVDTALAAKKVNKLALQKEAGLTEDENAVVIGLVSRLTDQKGLDLLNAIIPEVMDEHTQIVVLGTGDRLYEGAFEAYSNVYPGSFAAIIKYNEALAHRIYAGADAMLVPSRFEPCGLTQLYAMHYGAVPIVRETGGLKDTVLPYDAETKSGNGFTFVEYQAELLLDAINRAKQCFLETRADWDNMALGNMRKDVSWEKAAKKYLEMYEALLAE